MTKDGITVEAVSDQKDIKETAYDKRYPQDTTTARGGSQIALAGLVKPTDGYFAIKLKTNGVAKLLISSSNLPNKAYQTLTLPNTKNQWQTVAYPTNGGQAYMDFYAVVGKSSTKVTFAAASYTDQAALPVIGETARDTAVFLGHTITLKLSATNATTLTLADGPKGLQLAADGTLSWKPTAAGDYPVTVTATNGQRTVNKTFTISVKKDRTTAYNQATQQLSEGVYTTASMAKINTAAKAVINLLDHGDDAAFQSALTAYTEAIKQGELLNPTLEDHSLNYAAYPDMTIANLLTKDTLSLDPKQTFNTTALVDNDPASYGGDWMTPAVLDFGENYRVTLTSSSFLARTGFPNRTQGANLYAQTTPKLGRN
ncbi:putative Ig domain-containing protein [Lacticaseibacillus camelliae]|uniref:putative Ig domain-containing protein n=1 Tax=Lacticaseibacillus camelliae TaxID=381742 RepID=UPI0006D21848|nr:putative Ig domain-containing protein [Lacticaseibacillus camelliae]